MQRPLKLSGSESGSQAIKRLAMLLRRPELLVFLPALSLIAFWVGGEAIMMITALGLPILFILAGAFKSQERGDPGVPDALSGLAIRPQIIKFMDNVLENAAITGKSTACFVVLFDDANVLLDRHGRAVQTEVLARSAERLCAALREGDTVARLEGGGFAIALSPQRRVDLEGMLQVATRLQSALSNPISIDAARLYVTCSIGFCLGPKAPIATGGSLIDSAQVAADEALRNGPGAIRAFVLGMARKRADRDAFRGELETALDEGQIRPHYQPQICTDTGAISGFEALARWHHAERGLIPPSEFLPAIEDAGLSERLGEVMLYHALAALVRWDKAGLHVPNVGVNFSSAELRNPRLAEKLKWELDRFELTPNRLCIEILETVIAETDNDVIVHNISALAKLGCQIDLDDFGTGHASITNIRRFAVNRIKIDRSFVTHVDEDREQQKIVSGILSLAERMGLETLAEGVETKGEHAMLAQLGCGHVQGFLFARPMPFDDTQAWIIAQNARRSALPMIASRAR
ncbi:putative bifunctional diguanylate cyclase/phosphodiesterase [Pseudorhodobacter sp. W20_MBD10_FR17]|uniref:putative bifunctional diguanylate cyclase/phosphodiesterase n=1 Tax=Pseudorhodobacter sp. W20_MBD10_FR17 TaxID=3240266 RepID=UPI003F9A9453